jgi:hypothetical protein
VKLGFFAERLASGARVLQGVQDGELRADQFAATSLLLDNFKCMLEEEVARDGQHPADHEQDERSLSVCRELLALICPPSADDDADLCMKAQVV